MLSLLPMSIRERKALFLDRDGVINVEQRYVYSRDHFNFRDGVFELCRVAQALGYLLLIVTNQSGIARGYYTEVDFLELTEWMIQKFAEQQSQIARVYYCLFHPVHGIGRYKYDSPDRKPKPGMLLRARADFNLDLSSSVLIGDQLSDIDAAQAAGVGTKILLRSGSAETEIQGNHFYISDSRDKILSRFFSRPL